MKLQKKYQAPDAEISYLLDTEDGQFAEGKMRASVAEEIVHSAETRELGDRDGYELVVNSRMLFPKDAFAFDKDEEVERGKRTQKRKGRPTHAELVEKADKTMTNPQLYKAIEDAAAEKTVKDAGTGE